MVTLPDHQITDLLQAWNGGNEQALQVLTPLTRVLGQYDKGAAEGERAIEADSNFPPGYANLAWAYVFLDAF